LNDSALFHNVQKEVYTYIVVHIDHHQSTPCICKVQSQDVILPNNQVVHAANRKKLQYSPAKWQIVSALIATNLGSAQSATR
jgi:hypothetical protein